jgi:hypothetical protein
VSEPERLASELMADLHNNRLMTTVDLDGAANRIKDAIEEAIAAETHRCANIVTAIAGQLNTHRNITQAELAMAKLIRSAIIERAAK